MKTIGKKLPRNMPDGDFVAMCDYCGVPWYFSKMHRDRSGYLSCPRHGNGRDVVTLSEESAEVASTYEHIEINESGKYIKP